VQVVWCDDVKLGEVAQPNAPKLGVADTLAQAQSTAERNRIVASLLHLTGFSTFAYFALEFSRERVESLYLHEAFTPATYRGDYVRHSHHDVDPRTLGARVCNMPIVWDLQQLRREHRERDGGPCVTSAALDGFLQTMQDDGMCSGIMYSMAVPGTRLHAFMSFTAPRRTREWIAPTTIEQALSIGLSVHKFASPQLIATSRERAINAHAVRAGTVAGHRGRRLGQGDRPAPRHQRAQRRLSPAQAAQALRRREPDSAHVPHVEARVDLTRATQRRKQPLMLLRNEHAGLAGRHVRMWRDHRAPRYFSNVICTTLTITKPTATTR
jgi:hypothetical protein